MSEQYPLIRNDLTISHQQVSGENFYVIKAPETGSFYRFGEIEYFIIEQINGKNSLSAICDNVEQKYDTALSEQALSAFIVSLQQRGLLQQEEPSANSRSIGTKAIKGNWLHLRVNFFNPDCLLTFLAGKLGFLFTPTFVFLSTSFFITACLVAFSNQAEIERDIVTRLAVENLWALVFVLAVTAILHEFSHGLACKYFGGQVREIGFLLIFFMPAFFCNISDAWLFPQKSRRLWVAFAGAYCELLLWALAVFCWRMLAEETVIHYVALIMIATSGVRILLNFNPLIKLDGYYMLSDFLDIPNLRSKALAYSANRIKALFRMNVSTIAVSDREKIIFLAYGLLAGLFSLFILSYLATLLADFLVDELQGTGFIIFIGIIMVVFHRKLQNIVQQTVSSIGNGRCRRWFGKKNMKYIWPFVAALVVLFFKVDLTVSGEFEIHPMHNADIHAEIEAIIDDVYVREGDRVRKGDKLAHLSDREYQLELHKIEAQIKEHEAQLKMLTVGATEEEIALARSKVETAKTRYKHASKTVQEAEHIHSRHVSKLKSAIAKAQEQLRFAEKKLHRVEALSQKQVISQITLDQVMEEVSVKRNELHEAEAELRMIQANQHADIVKELAVSKNQVEQAEADLRKLLAGNRPEQIESIEAVIDALWVQRQYLQSDLQRVVVSSPIDGVVTTPNIQEKVGELVNKGDLILEVYQYDKAKVEMLIPEKEIGDVQTGQAVILKARAYPDKSFHGKVIAIAPTAMDDDGGLTRKVIRVTTEIDNAHLLLKPEMTGHAKINCGERAIFSLLSRRLLRYLKVEFWALW